MARLLLCGLTGALLSGILTPADPSPMLFYKAVDQSIAAAGGTLLYTLTFRNRSMVNTPMP
ncbi:MAG TPA: hypothetical protein VJV23_01315 [Candidatus Polarisedimenticolia bacterium]|nr:hypothetical protein [Candidatus Polarisedimenticolia bacterium]